MRQRERLNPNELRELDAIDRALAGEPVDADLSELEDLALDIRASAPEMTPAFAAALEQRVNEGFPTQGQNTPPRQRRRWMLVPAAGVLATVAIALVAVVGPSGNEESTVHETAMSARTEPGAALEDSAPSAAAPPTSTDGSLQRRQSESKSPPMAAAPALTHTGASGSRSTPAAAANPGASAADGAASRKVQRNALLVLEAPDGKVESTADAVIRTVDRFGGIVQSSSIGSSDATGGEASFDLRIPTGKLDVALAALSELGHVAERSQNLQDITGSFSSAQDRLADARAERRGLLRALGRATTSLQIESLRSRLRLVRSTIARLDGQLDSLRRRADLSTVQLTVRGGGKSDEGAAGGHWTPADAARDALRVLEVIAGVALIALAIALPLTLLGVAIVLGVRLGRRRRREGALDAA
ncbi:MAG: hypothetical protein QOI48_3442 [Solirubrobacteraceae bacterium]|jgi:hypothetical protein|nr:hypothetical protein [Solirubrobacteraceae bacterium]